MMKVIVCVLGLLLCFNSVFPLSGDKALLCQDPEDGSLHPVNTSWQSNLFCGNYTCKIRKKNTAFNDKGELKTQVTLKNADEIHTVCKDKNHKCHKDKSSFIAPMHTILLKIHNSYNQNDKSYQYSQYNKEDDDNYSSGSDFISHILNKVNHGDQDPLDEAYNLSKDYDGKTYLTTSDSNKYLENKKTSQTISYFYDPVMNKENMKEKSLVTAKTGHSIASKPLIYRVNDFVKNTSHPCDLKHQKTPKLVKMPFTVDTKKSLVRRIYLPFPILNAIRAAKTFHQETDSALNRPHQVKDNSITLNNVNEVNVWTNSTENVHTNMPLETVSTVILPHKNFFPGQLVVSDLKINTNPFAKLVRFPTKHPSFIKRGNQAWVQTNNLGSQQNQRAPFICSKSFLIKKLMLRKFDNKVRIPWHNDLNFLSNSEVDTRPVKTKLQRIGKVMKMDNLIRHRRHAAEEKITDTSDEYEYYLEKIVCPVDIELGYYKVGNSSQPFPKCCPQKIELLKESNPEQSYFKA